MSDRASETPGALSVYAYPWDLSGDPAAVEALQALGADRVVLAAAYHGVRAATPRHPRHRVVDARWSAVYAPFRDSAFAGQPITPRAPGRWATADAFTSARRTLSDLDVAGWLALTHADGDAASDEFRVVNAFGDVYPYALCPSHDAVVHFATTLVSECVAQGELSSVVIEAWGQLGLAHASEHEKTAAAGWTEADQQLLSICFCPACAGAYRERGADVARLRSAIARAVGTVRATAVRDLSAEVVLGARARSRSRMLSAVVPAARAAGATRIELHANDDPWATGPSEPLSAADAVPAVIAPVWAMVPESVERVRRMARTHPKVSAYVTMLGTETADDLVAFWGDVLAAGASALHLYHFGLVSADRLAAISAALSTLRDDQDQGGR